MMAKLLVFALAFLNSWLIRSSHGNDFRNELPNSGNLKSIHGFKAELVHRDSEFPRPERLRRGLKRSLVRAEALASKKGVSEKKLADLQAPVASANGAYTMELQLGTPAQKFKVIVDTGSDLIWVQCSPCKSCYTQDGAVFKPENSSTYSTIPCSNSICETLPTSICTKSSNTCKYEYQYGDASSSQGDYSTEALTLSTTSGGSKEFQNIKFGCGHANSGSFGGAAGIVGLGQGALSLISQLGTEISQKFSYCLVNLDDSPSQTSPLFLGEAAILSGSDVQFTPIVPNALHKTYYYVNLKSITIAGTTISAPTGRSDLNSGGTIFDSGTTLTLFTASIYTQIRDSFNSAVSLPPADGSAAGFDLCFNISGNRGYQFPAISLNFNGARMNPPPENYMVGVDAAGNVACLAMDSSGDLGLGIIGNIMQQNYEVLYDRSNLEVSFRPVNCDSL